MRICVQHDDSSAPNVLYHFSIPFYLALDIFSMQTHPTIHLFVIVFRVLQRQHFFSISASLSLLLFLYPERQHKPPPSSSFVLFVSVAFFYSFIFRSFFSSFLRSLHVFLSVELPFNVSTVCFFSLFVSLINKSAYMERFAVCLLSQFQRIDGNHAERYIADKTEV